MVSICIPSIQGIRAGHPYGQGEQLHWPNQRSKKLYSNTQRVEESLSNKLTQIVKSITKETTYLAGLMGKFYQDKDQIMAMNSDMR